ncbi:hypothetical protein EV363DRAFT_1136931, partial [Boletus edulis]
ERRGQREGPGIYTLAGFNVMSSLTRFPDVALRECTFVTNIFSLYERKHLVQTTEKTRLP